MSVSIHGDKLSGTSRPTKRQSTPFSLETFRMPQGTEGKGVTIHDSSRTIRANEVLANFMVYIEVTKHTHFFHFNEGPLKRKYFDDDV